MAELVLLPGMDGTATLFGPLTDALPGVSWRAIAYPPAEPLGYDALVAHVAERLPAGPHVIVAESFSGPVAIRLATRPPPGLVGIVLAATFSRSPARWAPAWLALAARGAFRLPPPARVVRALLVGEDAGDALVAAVQAAIARVSPDVLAHRVGEILSVDVREVPAVPVLILRAAGDRLVPADALAVEGRAVTLAGPHLVLQANARGAAAEIASFLVTVGRERAPA